MARKAASASASAKAPSGKPGVKPVGRAEFASLLAALTSSTHLAVAFSGGPDSLALLYLAARWAGARRGREILALTVDHGLREGSAAEARRAARMARDLGIAHRILTWQGEKPQAGLQAAAREARYRLLAAACRKAGVNGLLAAHHLEDQAETFLLRLARGSGVDGLAAMAPTRLLSGMPELVLLRPLLGVPRARLEATLAAARLEAIHDPSNENERFDRVKARRLLAELAPLGLDARRLADTAGHMARVRAALEAQTRALLAAHARLGLAGDVSMDADALRGAPEEIALRALAAIVKQAGGAVYPPRFEALSALHAALRAGTLGRGRTLGGAKLALDGARLAAMREPGPALDAPPLVLGAGEAGVWDRRFSVRLVRAPRRFGAVEVRALGTEGLAKLKAEGLAMPPAYRGPKAALAALPGLWQGPRLIGTPFMGFLVKGIEAQGHALKGALFETA